MYTIRMNLDTKMVEILVDDYVMFEVPNKAFDDFYDKVYMAYNFPSTMRKVRNAIPFTIGPSYPAFK